MVKAPVLPITNAATLVNKVTDRVEFCVEFDAKNDWKLEDGDLQAHGLVYHEQVVINAPRIDNNMASPSVDRIHDFERVCTILILKHFYFTLSPFIPSSNDECIVILTHAKDFSAQVVLEDVEEDLDVEPHTEVDED